MENNKSIRNTIKLFTRTIQNILKRIHNLLGSPTRVVRSRRARSAVTSARPLTSTSSAQLRLTSPQTPSTRQRGIVEPPCGRPAVNAGYVARMPNSTHSPAPQDQSGAPPVQRRQDWMRAHKRFPAASPVKVTPPWPQPRQSLEDDLSPAPQGYRNPISPRQEYRSTVSPAQGYRNPISPRQDYRSTVSPAQGYRNPVSPRQDYRNPISPRQDYRNPISPRQDYRSTVSPAQGYRNPISPPRGYRNPISTRQGYQSLPHVPRPMDPVASKCDKPVPKRYDDILEKLAAPKSAETAATVEEAAFTPLRNRSELEGKCASLDSTSTDGPLDSTSAGGSAPNPATQAILKAGEKVYLTRCVAKAVFQTRPAVFPVA